MRLENEHPVTIFSKEYNGNVYYNMGLSKKDQNNKYINGYMPCRFRKDVEIDDKKKIYIKEAWLDFYLKDKETKPYVFINKFDYVEDAIKKSKEDTDINDDFDLPDDELPF